MNDLQIFKNQEFGEVRTITKDNEVWFVGKDVAECLQYNEPNKAIVRHIEEDDRTKYPINDNLGRTQESWIINESGLYSLVLSSKLPSAKKFKRWVTSEVLPSIRKHGAYMTDDTLEKALTSPDFLIKLATNLKEEKEKRLLAEQKIEEQKTLVDFANKVATSQNSLLVREVAKIASKQGITIGEKRLWNKLREWNLIFKNSTEPKQYAIDKGYFEVVEGTRESSKGTFSYKTTRVTGKGQVYIVTKLQKELTDQEVACAK